MNKQIEIAAALCRQAFAAAPNATHAWCCHHEVFFEELSKPAESRIRYILSYKPLEEREVRLNNFRPILNMERFAPAKKAYGEEIAPADKAYREAIAAAEKAYDEAVAPAEEAYREAIAAAGKAYGEAIAAAQISSGLLALYKEEVPLGTWTGKSVFNLG